MQISTCALADMMVEQLRQQLRSYGVGLSSLSFVTDVLSCNTQLCYASFVYGCASCWYEGKQQP